MRLTVELRIPPGRAGRLWLRERLASARKAADLLDHKRRELEGELHRLETILRRRTRVWEEAMRTAQRWLSRVDVLNGGRALRVAAGLEPERAEVELVWEQVMGVRYPTDFTISLPPAPPVASLDGGAALTFALDAYRAAVQAAVAQAVARMAHDRIRADMALTVRRLRALELRTIPVHEEALRSLELRLDEKDREDMVGVRWAVESGEVSSGGER